MAGRSCIWAKYIPDPNVGGYNQGTCTIVHSFRCQRQSCCCWHSYWCGLATSTGIDAVAGHFHQYVAEWWCRGGRWEYCRHLDVVVLLCLDGRKDWCCLHFDRVSWDLLLFRQNRSLFPRLQWMYPGQVLHFDHQWKIHLVFRLPEHPDDWN